MGLNFYFNGGRFFCLSFSVEKNCISKDLFYLTRFIVFNSINIEGNKYYYYSMNGIEILYVRQYKLDIYL